MDFKDSTEIKEPGGVFRRLMAMLLDFIILGTIGSIVFFVVKLSIVGADNVAFFNAVKEGRILWSLLIVATDDAALLKIAKENYFLWGGGVIFLYFMLFEQSRWQGTLGKRMLNLKVEDSFGMRISFFRSLLRSLWSSMIILPGIIIMNHNICNIYMDLIRKILPIQPDILMAILGGAISFAFIWFIPILFTERNRGMYELLSGTRVVKFYCKCCKN